MDGIFIFLIFIFVIFPFLKSVFKAGSQGNSSSAWPQTKTPSNQPSNSSSSSQNSPWGSSASDEAKNEQVARAVEMAARARSSLQSAQNRQESQKNDRERSKNVRGHDSGSSRKRGTGAVMRAGNKSRSDWGTRGESGLTSSKSILTGLILIFLAMYIIETFF